MHGLADAPLGSSDLADRPDFALGQSSVSPSNRTIRGPGGEAYVEPRVMQVLVTLADAAGRVLSRDAIFLRCWGNVIVGDDSLNRVIGEIRRIGRTVAADGFVVETLPRTGYRLNIVPSGAGTPQHGAAPPEPESRVMPTRRVVLGGSLLAAAAAGGLALWLTRPDPLDARIAALLAQSDQALRSALPDSDAQGIGFLEEAVALRPDDPTAWGKLALARFYVAEHAPPQRVAAEVAAVQEAARRALALDPGQADAHSALALLPPYFGDWHAAEQRMDAVLRIDPDHLPTRDARAFLLAGVGRGREGSADRLIIAAREPLHAGQQYKLVYANWILGRIAAADQTADRALQLWPRHPGIWFSRLWTLAFTGRETRALAQVEDAAARPDLPPWLVDALRSAMVAMVSRRPADVARAADATIGLISRGPTLSIHGILILSGLGEIDRAFDVARAYLLEQGPLMASVRWREGQVSVNDQRRRKTHMLFVPVAAPMRADPRFLDLVQQIGLVDYWRRAGVVPDFLQGR